MTYCQIMNTFICVSRENVSVLNIIFRAKHGDIMFFPLECQYLTTNPQCNKQECCHTLVNNKTDRRDVKKSDKLKFMSQSTQFHILRHCVFPTSQTVHISNMANTT
jgi:hypothetical protein